MSPDDDPLADEPSAEFDEAAAHEFLAAVIDDESQRRLWIKAVTPLLQLRSRDTDPSVRVQLALDLMHIAACERLARLLRSDLKDDQA